MNVIYASDNNFAEILGVSMLSLLENNKECDEITVYILDDGINDDNKAKLTSIAESYNRQLIIKEIPNLHALAGTEIHTNDKWSLSTFSRLFLEKILPESVEKIIYIDCDMIVNDSLEEIYNLDMGDNLCAGVWDCMSDGNKKCIGLNGSNDYFNAGMLVISLKNWRKAEICNEFIKFIGSYDTLIPYVDQGVINGVMAGRIMTLPFRYNCYTVAFDFTYKEMLTYRKPSKFYSEEEVEAAKANPAIIHFTTSFLSLRPWIEGCEHHYVNEWLKYKKMSPWADTPLRKDNRSSKKKAFVKIFNILPRKMAVAIAGLLHSSIVPFIKKVKTGK